MYEDLIKGLRVVAKGETDKIFSEAADVIEKLSRLVDAIPHVCECCIGCELEKKNGGCDNAFILSPKRAMQYLIKPQWTPVTERLPEYCRNIIVTDGEYVSMGWLDNYRDRNGTVYITWYAPNSSANESHISHWMPLPEPPKDGE